MELKPINRICPRCGNGNYMRIIDGKNVGKLNVKCINCNSYYNYEELLKGDNSKSLNGTEGRTIDDLISRAAAIERMKAMAGCDACNNYGNVRCRACSWDDAMNIVEELPAVDAAPVVRCKDCAHYGPEPYGDVLMCYRGLGYMGEDGFCSLAERREDA